MLIRHLETYGVVDHSVHARSMSQAYLSLKLYILCKIRSKILRVKPEY